jgi:universal stress protein A
VSDIERIVVLSRTTKYCQKAVHYGIQLARIHEAELHVVHYIHDPFGLEGWNIPLPSLADLEDEYKRLQEEAKRDLDEMINKEAAAGLPVEVIVIEGEMIKELSKFVKDKKIDLLIVRAHQEGRLEHFLYGHSNEKLIRMLPCSVLLVKDEPKAGDF